MTRAILPLAIAVFSAVAAAQTPARNAKGQLVCPVMKSVVASADKATGFSDYGGKRYYFCCGGCKPAFDAAPAKYALASKTTVPPPATATRATTVKVGPYVVELFPPDDGLAAGAPLDMEFGVFDSRLKAADGGLTGVDGVLVKAAVDMPSMAGMPVQRPTVHKEGRAGVYGLELDFPHGGTYRIAMTLTSKAGVPMKATFLVDVGDERGAPVKPPYALKVVDFPATARAGVPVSLRMRIVDTKTGAAVRSFDVAHEMRFHLLLASKDLTRFMHEHPTMAADGTWTYRATFPAGGEWRVYGDVAPTGKGSRILSSTVKVAGAPPSGRAMRATNAGPFTSGDLTGRLVPVGGAIETGRSTTLRVLLTDARTGRPAGDTTPWLGAAGHLMIIHEDGSTVVHSHPDSGQASQALVRKGEVRFAARFPKPGRYVAYAQVKRGGTVRTLGFTVTAR